MEYSNLRGTEYDNEDTDNGSKVEQLWKIPDGQKWYFIVLDY